jgi:hypothetical protein
MEHLNQNPEEITNISQEENPVSFTEKENAEVEEITAEIAEPEVKQAIEEEKPEPAEVIQEEIVAITEPIIEETPVLPSTELSYLAQVSDEAHQDNAQTSSVVDDLHLEAGVEILHDETEELKHDEEFISTVNYDELNREELVALMEKTVEEADVNGIKTQVALAKVAFLKATKEIRTKHYEQFIAEGGVKEEYEQPEDQLDERFRKAFNIYKTNKLKFNEEQEQEKLKNLDAKKRILDELKSLISSEETLKKTYDDFRSLQDQWKQVGMVPRTEANMLWQNYHFLVEKFFDKVKINNELKDLDLRKNLEAKIALCEKAEALLLETSILKSFKQLQQYHDEWKEIGPVPQDKKDEIWNRFKDATDKINERRRDYYNEIKDEQEGNLMAKNALCDQAEKVVAEANNSIKQWQDTTNQLTELQKVWRTIGPAPKAQNEEVWQRFKGLIDGYFAVKKEYFGAIKEEQLNNYNIKLDLCVQAEALRGSSEWKKTTQDLILLQEEWKKVGPVPRKHSDKIWKRFRAACDEFFAAKSSHFSTQQAAEQENLQKKEALIAKVDAYVFTEDRKENLDILNSFQREWMEIGHVPIKEKDRLQAEFRKTINKQLDKLKISAVEMSTMEYKNRYDNIVKDSPDAFRTLSREKVSMSQKVKQLQEDIHLWENNIGFLAASKNATILKEEFEKKINKAKEEMKLLEAKLKLLRES